MAKELISVFRLERGNEKLFFKGIISMGLEEQGRWKKNIAKV